MSSLPRPLSYEVALPNKNGPVIVTCEQADFPCETAPEVVVHPGHAAVSLLLSAPGIDRVMISDIPLRLWQKAQQQGAVLALLAPDSASPRGYRVALVHELCRIESS